MSEFSLQVWSIRRFLKKKGKKGSVGVHEEPDHETRTRGSCRPTLGAFNSPSHTGRPLWKTAELLLNYTAQVRIPASTSTRIRIYKKYLMCVTPQNSRWACRRRRPYYGQYKVSLFLVPSPELQHLSVLLLDQFGDETPQDGHFKLDILRHLVGGSRRIRGVTPGKSEETKKRGRRAHGLRHTWLLRRGLPPWGTPCRPAHTGPASLGAPAGSRSASVSCALETQTQKVLMNTQWGFPFVDISPPATEMKVNNSHSPPLVWTR